MARYILVLAVCAIVHEGTLPTADAQENPVVRSLVRDAMKRELAARDSKEKGWHQGDTWLWLENPAANLAADVNTLTLENGRFTIEGRVYAVVGFQHKVKMLIGSKTFAGQAGVYLTFRASAQVGDKLSGSRVSIGRLDIHDLHLRGDAARPFQGMIQDGVNMVLRNKKHDIEKKLEEALNKTTVAR